MTQQRLRAVAGRAVAVTVFLAPAMFVLTAAQQTAARIDRGSVSTGLATDRQPVKGVPTACVRSP